MRRRGAGGGAAPEGGESSNNVSRANSTQNVRDSAPETSYENGENGHKIAFDPRDLSESAERSKQPKLTMMEEVLLLGLKDKQVRHRLNPLRIHPTRPSANSPTTRRATSLSGTITSPTPSAVASCSS